MPTSCEADRIDAVGVLQVALWQYGNGNDARAIYLVKHVHATALRFGDPDIAELAAELLLLLVDEDLDCAQA